MTTQTLSQAIHLRREMPLDELLQFAPQLAGYAAPAVAVPADDAAVSAPSRADRAFWTTFSFGSVQALVMFGLIYAYFAL